MPMISTIMEAAAATTATAATTTSVDHHHHHHHQYSKSSPTATIDSSHGSSSMSQFATTTTTTTPVASSNNNNPAASPSAGGSHGGGGGAGGDSTGSHSRSRHHRLKHQQQQQQRIVVATASSSSSSSSQRVAGGGDGGTPPKRRTMMPLPPPPPPALTTTTTTSRGNSNNNNNNVVAMDASALSSSLEAQQQQQQQQLLTTIAPPTTSTTTNNNTISAADRIHAIMEQEQLLFEQRLTVDPAGIAVRKINQHGKAALRYVKCCTWQEVVAATTATTADSSNHSVTSLNSWGRRRLSKLRQAGTTTNTSSTTSNTTSGSQNSAAAASTSTAAAAAAARQQQQHHQQQLEPHTRVLVWGKQKQVYVPLESFLCVRKGKTTARTKRNNNPSCRLLSLITCHQDHPSLDIEAPTQLDRDKFARAFARFLQVPLIQEATTAPPAPAAPFSAATEAEEAAAAAAAAYGNDDSEHLLAADEAEAVAAAAEAAAAAAAERSQHHHHHHQLQNSNSSSLAAAAAAGGGGGGAAPAHLPPRAPRSDSLHSKSSGGGAGGGFGGAGGGGSGGGGGGGGTNRDSSQASSSSSQKNNAPIISLVPVPVVPSPLDTAPAAAAVAATAAAAVNAGGLSPLEQKIEQDHVHSNNKKTASGHNRHGNNNNKHNQDDENNNDQASDVSSITGHGYDQDLVEELHLALTELRAELEASRAEAARAVKVAEQAIQSAERNSSQDWQNTVTHKAAEAAALAQKRSAEAMAKQRVAEEKLQQAVRSAQFWKQQAAVAEEEAGMLQTAAAAAAVQRAALQEYAQSELQAKSRVLEQMKHRYTQAVAQQRSLLEAALERNRMLEVALEQQQDADAAAAAAAAIAAAATVSPGPSKRRGSAFRRRKSASSGGNNPNKIVQTGSNASSDGSMTGTGSSNDANTTMVPAEQLRKLHAETAMMRQQLELLRRETADELALLPADCKIMTDQVATTIMATDQEVARLRERLATESAARRKLLQEVQDLRGCVRVYCRLKRGADASGSSNILSLASQDTLTLHREMLDEEEQDLIVGPTSFEYDRIFDPDMGQTEVYSELEEVCLGVLDGYNICFMGFGQYGSGKTHTILGDCLVTDEGKVHIQNYGIQLQAMEQVFSISERRSDRYKDTFTLTVVEVHNERLLDLLAGTQTGEHHGQVVVAETKSSSSSSSKKKSRVPDGTESTSSSKHTKLEIRTDNHGETIVQGLLSVQVDSFEDFRAIWEECLEARLQRLVDLDIDPSEYDRASHIIATVKVVSANITTGMGTVGKIQFVDLASADVVRRQQESPKSSERTSPEDLLSSTSHSTDWQFANKSLETLQEVVVARSQFARSVPYRNSTLTHLLRDSVEHDTKVVLMACVSCDPENVHETVSTLRFASSMRRVNVGKATRHMLTAP